MKKSKSGQSHPSNRIDRIAKPVGSQSRDGVKVAQGYALAGVGVRLAALLYDFLLVAAVVLVVGVIAIGAGTTALSAVGNSAAEATQLPAWYNYLVVGPLVFVSVYGFYGYFWRKSGQTLGMQTWRLMTVRRTGKFLSWRDSLKRCLAALILPIAVYLATRIGLDDAQYALRALFIGFLFNYVFALVHPAKRTPHDLLSHSLTIRVPKRQGGIISDLRARFGKK